MLRSRLCTASRQTRQISSASSPRVVKVLYRQLLRWCQNAEARIGSDVKLPLSKFVPPIYIESPTQVDGFRLELLALKRKGDGKPVFVDPIVERVAPLIHERAKINVKNTGMTIPIHSTNDLRNFFRAIFRLNHDIPSPEYQKERVDVAFDALRNLNELTGGIEALNKRREKHSDRSKVKFRIGQVVQHTEERWRGVIVGWEKPTEKAEASPSSSSSDGQRRTSLTMKMYTASDEVRYNIVLDAGDAHSMGSSSGEYTVSESDIVLVTDPYLRRVRSSSMTEHFSHFDASSGTFVPRDMLQYEYPNDRDESLTSPATISTECESVCKTVLSGIDELVKQMLEVINKERSLPISSGLTLLSGIENNLNQLLDRDILPYVLQFSPNEVPLPTLAAHTLRSLLNIQLEVMDINLKRDIAKKNLSKIDFQIGEIVYHKKYDFRGVVVGWDPTPQADVSRWDGLRDIENPDQYPFYHVIPDQNDCQKAFGGPRSFRYVCQENLEVCPDDRRIVDVELGPEWIRNPLDASFEAPSEVRYKYGADLRDGGVTERVMTQLEQDMNAWQLAARNTGTTNMVAAHKASFTNLLVLLKVVSSASDAAPVQEMIKEMRKAHESIEVRRKLEIASNDLISGQAEKALDIYTQLIEDDTTYVEAWNKRATCEFMLGRHKESMASTKRTLELDRLHFQAMNGLGLLHFGRDEYKEAIAAFQKSIDMDPWSPVGSKLSTAHDLVTHMIDRDELSR